MRKGVDRMKINRLLAFSLLFGSLTLPCLASPPYNVDDPGTQAAGYSLMALSYSSTAAGGKKETETSQFCWKYGITRDLEFMLLPGVTSVLKEGKGRETGLGDTYLQLKYRFLQETKSTPGIAFGYKFKAPTADAIRGLGSGVNDDSVWLTAGKSFHRFGVYGNLGYTWQGASHTEDFNFYGVVFTYKATEHLQLGVQYYGNSPKAGGTLDEEGWGVGAIYKFAPDRSVIVSLSKSEHGFSNFSPYVGYVVHFK